MNRNRWLVTAIVVCCGCSADSGAQRSSSNRVPVVGGARGPASTNLPAQMPVTQAPPPAQTLPTNPAPTMGAAGTPAAPGMIGATPPRGAAGARATMPPATPGMMPATPGMMPAAPGMTMPPVATSANPVIPEIKGDCPSLESGPINYMGVNGTLEAGPKPDSASAPMLLYWHGTGSSAGEYSFMAAAIAQGVTSQGGIVVSFDNTTNKGDCSISGTAIFCTGDFELMDQYVACGVKNRNVDPHRIYTAGCSAGGLTATAMAAQRSGYIAAAAPNSGGGSFFMFSGMHTPPLMTIHGAMGTDVVGIDFAQSSASADMAFKQRGAFVIDCDTGGQHCGGGGLAGDAWKFFQAHPYGVDPEPWAGMLPAGFSSQCMLK